MVKTKEQLLKLSKDRRAKYAEENKQLKIKKGWYPVENKPSHFRRISKIPKKTHIHKELTPGQIVILLSGRFRGRRVVFIKKLVSGLLLVTGPYKINGVPLKRVNQAYVLPTSTKLNVKPSLKTMADELFPELDFKERLVDKANKDEYEKYTKEKQEAIEKVLKPERDFFAKVKVERKTEKDFFAEPATIKARITDKRKNAQSKLDTEILTYVSEVPELKDYLKNRFALKNGDKPHLMKF